MIRVICKDDKFLVKGTFSIGIAGVFENKDYGEGNIEIQYGLKETMEDINTDYSWMQPLKPILENVPQDGDSVAKALEDYYNSKELLYDNDVLNLSGGWLQVQFSDGWGDNFFCSAYEEFDENLAPNDWHNF